MVRAKRILCPVDFSEFSRRALLHAAAIARWHGAELTALHVSPVIPPAPLPIPVTVGSPPLDPSGRERLAEALQDALEPARQAHVRTSALVLEGDPVELILREAKRLAADLVVMGTHGARGFERWVLGSVTEKVLRKASCPVLTVPHDQARAPGLELFGPILCPVDFSVASGEALVHAVSLARETRSPLILLHVVDAHLLEDPRALMHFDMPNYRSFLEVDAREQLEALLPERERQDLHVEDVVAAGKAWREILRVAAERGAACIVIGVRGRGALELAIFGSTTNQVVREARCPVLTVHPPTPDVGSAPARRETAAVG